MALIRMESYGISIAPQLALIYHPTYITNTMLTLHLAVCVCVSVCVCMLVPLQAVIAKTSGITLPWDYTV